MSDGIGRILVSKYEAVADIGGYYVCRKEVGVYRGTHSKADGKIRYGYDVISYSGVVIHEVINVDGISLGSKGRASKYFDIGRYKVLAMPESELIVNKGVAVYLLILLDGEKSYELGGINRIYEEGISVVKGEILIIPTKHKVNVFDLVKGGKIIEEDGWRYDVSDNDCIGIFEDRVDGHIEYESTADDYSFVKVGGKKVRKTSRMFEIERLGPQDNSRVNRFSIEYLRGDVGTELIYKGNKEVTGRIEKDDRFEVLWDGWEGRLGDSDKIERFEVDTDFLDTEWVIKG
jgi:hypothetical protein